MEDYNQGEQKRNKQNKKDISLSFQEQIQKIQIRRQNQTRNLLRIKKQQRQNLKPYKDKKSIVPSFLKPIRSSYTFQIIKPDVFKLNFRKNDSDQQSQQRIKSEVKQNKNRNNTLLSNKESLSRMSKGWKLQMTSQEINGLYFGKQIKNNINLREKYVRKQKIKQLRSLKLFNKRSNVKSYHFYCRNKNNVNIQSIARDKQVKSYHRQPDIHKININSNNELKKFKSLKKQTKQTQPVRVLSDYVSKQNIYKGYPQSAEFRRNYRKTTKKQQNWVY